MTHYVVGIDSSEGQEYIVFTTEDDARDRLHELLEDGVLVKDIVFISGQMHTVNAQLRTVVSHVDLEPEL